MREGDPEALNHLAMVAERMPHAALSGRTAGWLHGLELAWKPVEVTVADGHCSARANISLRRASLGKGDVVIYQGLRVTSPLRTAVDLGRKLRTTEAVLALDMAFHAGLVGLGDLRSYLASHRGAKGIARLRRAVELADPKSESPMETRLRLLICRAGLPRPQSQFELFDPAGRFLARVDFYYPAHRLAIEYDGATHRESLAEDNRRQNGILEAGHRLLRFSAADLQQNPDRVASQIATALSVSARKRRRYPAET